MTYSQDMRFKALASLAASASGIEDINKRIQFREAMLKRLRNEPDFIDKLLAQLRDRETAQENELSPLS